MSVTFKVWQAHFDAQFETSGNQPLIFDAIRSSGQYPAQAD
jgi:hypothetical protein